MKDGMYNLYTPGEKEPVLVHGYHCTDQNGEFVFGFNVHDGGGIVSSYDLNIKTVVVPVDIIERKL